MCCNVTSQYRKQQKMSRLIAALACVCFVAALLLSSAFVSPRSRHEHDHNGADGGCSACAGIGAENLLKTISAAAAVSVVAVGTMFSALPILEAERFGIADSTLISLKTRLNN